MTLIYNELMKIPLARISDMVLLMFFVSRFFHSAWTMATDKLDWRKIGHTLNDQLFFEDDSKRSELEQAFNKYCNDNEDGISFSDIFPHQIH